MKNLKIKNNKIFYVSSGTLGDAFIVFCKLENFIKNNHGVQVYLEWHSIHKNMLILVENFFKIVEPSIIVDTVLQKSKKDVNEAVFSNKKKDPINSNSNGYIYEDGIKYSDPIYLKMNPFPLKKFKKKFIKNQKIKIGFQVHTGKNGYNKKIISPQWIKETINGLDRNIYEVILYGNDNALEENKIFKNLKVINLINKLSFKDWMKKIKKLDFLVSPEGFSAFWAMSNKVTTLMFYNDDSIIERLHKTWIENNIIIYSKNEKLIYKIIRKLRRIFYISDYNVASLRPFQARSIIKNLFKT